MPELSAKEIRQDKILMLLCNGYNITEIAKELGITRQTVYTHIHQIGDLKISEELMGQQLKLIEDADTPRGLKMLYIDKLMGKLRPLKREAKVESTGRVEIFWGKNPDAESFGLTE